MCLIDVIVKYIGLTENEIIAQSMLFLLGGYETTATTLSFVTYCLALNPDCQERLHEEIVRAVGDKVGAQLTTVHYLHIIIQLISCVQVYEFNEFRKNIRVHAYRSKHSLIRYT